MDDHLSEVCQGIPLFCTIPAEEPILWDDECLMICDNQDVERQGGSGSSVHIGDGSTSEGQDRGQGGERSSLSTPPTSIAGSEAG